MAYKLYDYANKKGGSDVASWLVSLRLPKAIEAKLKLKLDMLEQSGGSLPPKLLAGTPHGDVKKLKVTGVVTLRLMLCKGPINNDEEYTLLLGAVEKDRKLIPKDAYDIAEKRRKEIISNPLRRCKHERI